jgi:DNA polymerase IV
VLELFEKLYQRRMLLRLVGVRLSGLVHGNHQISLFDDTAENISLYQAIDHVKHRYGTEKIIRANTIDVNKRVRMELNMFKGNIKIR